MTPFKDTGTVAATPATVPGQRTAATKGALPPWAARGGAARPALPAAGGAGTPKTPHRKEATMNASNAAAQEPAEEAAKELPKRTRQPRALAPVPAEAAGDAPEAAPETAPEATATAAEPKPKWPPIGPQLDREFPHLTGPVQDVFAGLMAFNGMAAAHEAIIAEDKREALDASAAILAEADRAHEAVRAHARYVPVDVCAYPAEAGLAFCTVHGTLAGAVMVQEARVVQEARALDEVAATLAGQHHEPGQHPWLDTMRLELSAGESAPDGDPAA